MNIETIKLFLIALLIGFLIGMQRSLSELKENKISYFGSRTFALLSLVGFLSIYLQKEFSYFFISSFLVVGIIVALSYYFKGTTLKDIGATTQVAALISFLLGAMVALGKVNFAIFIGVFVITLLELKPTLLLLERHIGEQDIKATILLLLMTFVILPILPDKMIDPWHLFNPYKTWAMAVIIAAISFVGYLAIKILGQKHGVFLTGAAGGLISSTAVSISLSKMFKKQYPLINAYAGGIAIACTFMYVRVLFETLVINYHLALFLLPSYLSAAILGLIYSYYMYKHSSEQNVEFQNEELSKNPLQLSEALKFGLLFGIIYGAIAFVQGKYGNLGVYAVSFFSGLTDVDAITLSLSQLFSDGKLALKVSAAGIVIASVTNSIVKLLIVYYLGGVKLGNKVASFFLITLSALIAGLFI